MALKPTDGFLLPYSNKHEDIANKGPIFIREWNWWKKLAFCTTVAVSLWYFYLFVYRGDTTDVLPASATETIHPNSFESDPDPSTATYCTVAYDLKKPIVQFAVVLYIGLDSPPRSYIYKFNNCKAFPALEYVRVEQGNVPFKHYAGLGVEMAATTLTPVFNSAMHVIPMQLHHRTLMSVKLDSALRKDKVLSLWKDSKVLGVIAHRVQRPFRLHTVRYTEETYVNGPPLGVAIEMLVGNLGRQLLKY